MTVLNPEKQVQYAGLTASEVAASRKQHGSNLMTPPPRNPWWELYLRKFDDPVIRILLLAAALALTVGLVEGQYIEGLGIIVAIFLATSLAFFNEYRANRAFDILNQVNDEVPITVIRAGNYTPVARKDVVVGDIVLLEPGAEVPADGRLLEGISLQVNESRLTGEPMPVYKAVNGDDAHGTEAIYPPDVVLRGTMVADGRGVIEITAVGDTTEIGKTAHAATATIDEQTPLNRQLDRLSKFIGVVGFTVAVLIYAALLIRGILAGEFADPATGEALSAGQWYFVAVLTTGVVIAATRIWLMIYYDARELLGHAVTQPDWLKNDSLAGWGRQAGLGLLVILLGVGAGRLFGSLPAAPGEWLPGFAAEKLLKQFMVAVTIIVVAVPEGLAMSVTLSLAYSMRRMTATHNLVRRMHAVETIGAATVICSDKTGTLTLNEMRVHEMAVPCLADKLPANGTFNRAEGLLVEAVAANSTANLDRNPDDAQDVLGNPTEGALLLWLEAQGIDYMAHRAAFAIHSQLTFSTERKFMGTLGVSSVTHDNLLHIKGAPEIVLERCAAILTREGVEALGGQRAEIETALKSCQQRGMRTLGFAYREVPPFAADESIEDLAAGLTWLGFVAISDPIRADVPDAVRAAARAGVQVKIVTGDNPDTAREIASQIDLLNGDEFAEGALLTGPEFARLSDEEARARVGALKILSRARPGDKMRLVRLLQENGEIVAVTGDGTNDAPALNYANVGLSMGKTGTSVAKEASDIVLLDDSFRSIVNAIMWGRSLFDNIQRFILFQLTINVTALSIAFLGPFLGVELPLTVTQMLWVNLIMDTFAALALATEPPHWNVMQRTPRDSREFIVSRPMMKAILGVGAAFVVTLIALLRVIQGDGAVSNYELSLFFTVFILLQFWNLFNARQLGMESSALKGLTENRNFLLIAAAILGGQILFVQLGGEVFRTVPLTLRDWLLIILGTSLVFWGGEVWRRLRRPQAGSPA